MLGNGDGDCPATADDAMVSRADRLDPEDGREAAVLAAYERHHGAMNDAILTIIRHSSADDLTDPRLAAIKARMFEAIGPLLGPDGVRQLVLYNIKTESM